VLVRDFLGLFGWVAPRRHPTWDLIAAKLKSVGSERQTLGTDLARIMRCK